MREKGKKLAGVEAPGQSASILLDNGGGGASLRAAYSPPGDGRRWIISLRFEDPEALWDSETWGGYTEGAYTIALEFLNQTHECGACVVMFLL